MPGFKKKSKAESTQSKAKQSKANLLDDAVEQLAPCQGLHHDVKVGGVSAIKLVDAHHVRVVQPPEDAYL